MTVKRVTIRRLSVAVFLLVMLVITPAGFAEVKLPSLISNNMVLQQNSSVPIWGWAEAGERIEVVFDENPAVRTVAGKDGRWMVKIKTPAAGGPYEMTISGSNTITVRHILIGEVWLCSGQSNMEMPVAWRNRWLSGVQNYGEEVLAANYPGIRLFQVKRATADKPQSDCMGWWVSCSPATVANFSAAGYFFGRALHKELKVPIGLIYSTWGGTPAESWTRHEVLEADSVFKPILDHYAEAVAEYPQAVSEYKSKMKEWKKQAKKAKAQGKLPPRKPWPPLGPEHQNRPSALYNGMIAPLIPYEIKGVIWYQGESNTSRPYQYRKLFPALIKNWRSDWRQGDFAFYYAQIAPFDYKWKRPTFAAELREAQLMAMSLPNTGMVVTMDIGDVNDVHPKNKQEVGRRFALWALAKTYGRDLVYSGPIYKKMKVEGSKIRLFFDYVCGGLAAGDGLLREFTIAGSDRRFFAAKAEIDGDTVVVSSEKVSRPVAVRFGWRNTALPNLFNKAGLPATPFRTDKWVNADIKEKW